MSVKIKPYDGIMCVECGKEVHSYDEYEWVRRTRTMGGGVIYIHTECYQELLKSKNTNNEILM